MLARLIIPSRTTLVTITFFAKFRLNDTITAIRPARLTIEITRFVFGLTITHADHTRQFTCANLHRLTIGVYFTVFSLIYTTRTHAKFIIIHTSARLYHIANFIRRINTTITTTLHITKTTTGGITMIIFTIKLSLVTLFAWLFDTIAASAHYFGARGGGNNSIPSTIGLTGMKFHITTGSAR